MALEITRIEPFDDAAVDAWWDAYAEAERADRGSDATVWSREESRSELQQQSTVTERRAYLLRDGGTVAGSASLALPRRDNTHIARLGISVRPEHRRRGFGSEVLIFLEREAAGAGRTVAQSTASWPYVIGPDGTGSPGREFARSRGYDLALGDVQSRLPLPVAVDALERVQADITAAIADYTIRSWVGPVPNDIVEDWAFLDAAVDTEAPSGDLDIEPTPPDVDSIRESERLLDRQGRTSFGTIALALDGSAAAYTQLVISGDDGNAYQWGTLVRAAHRGHRLGTAVKLANLRMLQHDAPHARAVITYNAESNAHMLAVNTLLGFRPSERMGELQKRLS